MSGPGAGRAVPMGCRGRRFADFSWSRSSAVTVARWSRRRSFDSGVAARHHSWPGGSDGVAPDVAAPRVYSRPVDATVPRCPTSRNPTPAHLRLGTPATSYLWTTRCRRLSDGRLATGPAQPVAVGLWPMESSRRGLRRSGQDQPCRHRPDRPMERCYIWRRAVPDFRFTRIPTRKSHALKG